MVNLRKPLAKGTKLTLVVEGESSEWIVIGHDRKDGRYTGYLRIEHQGWLSASVLEEDVREQDMGVTSKTEAEKPVKSYAESLKEGSAFEYIVKREKEGVAMPIGWWNMSSEMVQVLAYRMGWQG